MKVVITHMASFVREQVVRYLYRQFGEKAVLEFRQSYKTIKQQLVRFPESGAIEWNLSDEDTTYRSVVIARLSKMVYYVEEDTIYIVDFWDTRKEPPTEIE